LDEKISVLDQQKSKVPSLYDHIDIIVKNFSRDKPLVRAIQWLRHFAALLL